MDLFSRFYACIPCALVNGYFSIGFFDFFYTVFLVKDLIALDCFVFELCFFVVVFLYSPKAIINWLCTVWFTWKTQTITLAHAQFFMYEKTVCLHLIRFSYFKSSPSPRLFIEKKTHTRIKQIISTLSFDRFPTFLTDSLLDASNSIWEH